MIPFRAEFLSDKPLVVSIQDGCGAEKLVANFTRSDYIVEVIKEFPKA